MANRLQSAQTYKQEILFRSNNFFRINHAVRSKLHLVTSWTKWWLKITHNWTIVLNFILSSIAVGLHRFYQNCKSTFYKHRAWSWERKAVGSPGGTKSLCWEMAYQTRQKPGHWTADRHWNRLFQTRLSKSPHNEVACYCRKYLCSNIKPPGSHEQYFPGDKRSIDLKKHSSISSKIRKKLKYVWMIFYTIRNYKIRVKSAFAGLFKFYCVHEKWSIAKSSQGLMFSRRIITGLLQIPYKTHYQMFCLTS